MRKKSKIYKLTLELPCFSSYPKDCGFFSTYKKAYEAYQKLAYEKPEIYFGTTPVIKEIELDKI